MALVVKNPPANAEDVKNYMLRVIWSTASRLLAIINFAKDVAPVGNERDTLIWVREPFQWFEFKKHLLSPPSSTFPYFFLPEFQVLFDPPN